MNPADYYGFLPIIVLVGWACVLLLVDLFIPADRKAITAILSALGLIAAMAVTIYQSLQYGVHPPASTGLFNNMAVFDGFGLFFEIVVLVSGLIGVAIAYDYLKRLGMERGEYYTLLLFTISGMMLMSMAADLIVVFLALELLSFPLYILSGFARP